MVDVDDPVPESGDEFRRKDAHVFRQHQVLRFICGDHLQQLRFLLFARLPVDRHMMKGNAEFFRQLAQRVVVTDHRDNVDRQCPRIVSDEKVADTVALLRCQHHDVLLPFSHKLDEGPFRKNHLYLADHLFPVYRSTEFRTHEETVGFLFDKFTVAHDVQVVLIQDPRDCIDQSLAVTTGDEENIRFQIVIYG